MYNNFEENAKKILVDAKKEMYELKHPYIGSEHLLLAILKDNNSVSKKLKEYNLTYEKFKQEIIKVIGIGSKESEYFLYTPLLKRILENALEESKDNNENITVDTIFNAILEEGEGIAIRLLLGMNINIDELYSDFTYVSKKSTSLTTIEEIGINLNKKALNNELDPVIGREKEIKRVLEILSRRTKNNPILIGDAGVGKTAIVEELSRMIVAGDVPMCLQNKKIISLDMASTVAGTKYRGEFEERMRKILNEIEHDQDIILFIDEIHTLVGAGGAEGAIDASNIFKPALARNKIRCIGATTTNEYKKFIERDSALDRRFQKVYIEKPNINMVKDILNNLKEIYSKYHKVEISNEIIDYIIELSEKYIYDRNQPDKSIDILDEVCAKVSLKDSKELIEYKKLNKDLKLIISDKNKEISNNNFIKASTYKIKENELITKINNLELKIYQKNDIKIVTKKDVIEVIESRTKIPIFEFKTNDKKIKEINRKLNNDVLGQKEAINKIINIIKRKTLGLDDNKVSSYLFVGPSGVGKTMLSKELGKYLGNSIIKLDMSEYYEAQSINKLIGAQAGYVGYDDNNIFEKIRNNPYSVLILDEIDKANTSIINLFYQILDEGHINDSRGNDINFNNVTIIMTSNIGTNNSVGFDSKKIDVLKEYFSAPFINRIDDIITFKSLNYDDIYKIVLNELNLLKNKYCSIEINLSENLIKNIIEESNYLEFGARKIKKIIKNKLESIIIDSLIEGKKVTNI